MKFFKPLLLIALGLILAYSWWQKEPEDLDLSQESPISLYIHETGEVLEIPLEEYVVGVVAAEMPAAFPLEALKAQAVAARTYVLKHLEPSETTIHPEAAACDDPQHFQGWISPKQRKANWGKDYREYEQKIEQAVLATSGQILTWEEQLIDPVYHASCGGNGTRNSEEVWSHPVAYLKGVNCPYDADPQPFQTTWLPESDLSKALTLASGAACPQIGVIAYASTGNPQVYLVEGQEYSAADLRKALDLRSINFRVERQEDGWEVQTIGHGHGVGMCQYGAKGYADQGEAYQAILNHYYTGVKLTEQPIISNTNQ